MPKPSIICEAIVQRRLIRITYGGKTRLVEPYCHGTSKKGDDVLRAFQVSSPDGQDGWRMFVTTKITGAFLSDESFDGNRTDYNPEDDHMVRVHCCI